MGGDALNAIQSTIYYTLRDIDFCFVFVSKNGIPIAAEEENFLAKLDKALAVVASDDTDWRITARTGEKVFFAKYYLGDNENGNSYLVAVTSNDLRKQDDVYFVEYLKNGCRLEHYQGTKLIEERRCGVKQARSAIKRLLRTEFG